MIKPHGAESLTPLYVVEDEIRANLIRDAEQLPSIRLTSAAAANAVMLGGGYFTPLSGFMDRADALQVAESMHTVGGLFWPVPILNLTNSAAGIEPGARLALRDPNVEGHPVMAIQSVDKVEMLSDDDLDVLVQKTFRTNDSIHPGVAAFLAQGDILVSGAIQVLNFSYFESEFAGTFRTAYQIREAIEQRGWQKVVAFQTRNPMHRAHEELCRMAQAATGADGIVIHMLLGKLKPGDIPAPVRDAAIRKMVELYFPANTVLITGYGFDMLYAGPREAVLHAVFRQNAGCTHLIVGRDHAGVGDYYGAFDAQAIFDDGVPAGALQIEIFRADHTAYSKKLDRVVMMRDAPDHTEDDFVILSGTKVREMLSAGNPLPEEFARSEVAQILMDHYRAQTA